MRFASRSLSTVLFAGLIAATTSCATVGITQSLEPQLEDVRAIRADLTADWQAIETSLNSVEGDLAAFSNQRINTEGVDPRVVREAIEVPEEVGTEDVADASEEAEARMASYETSIEGLDDEARAEVEAVRSSGARIRQQLYVELPDSLAAVSKRAAGASIELAKIKATADQMKPVADENPLMTAADKSKFDRDHAALNSEIQSVGELAERIVRDSGTYGERVATATTQFNFQLSSLGE